MKSCVVDGKHRSHHSRKCRAGCNDRRTEEQDAGCSSGYGEEHRRKAALLPSALLDLPQRSRRRHEPQAKRVPSPCRREEACPGELEKTLVPDADEERGDNTSTSGNERREQKTHGPGGLAKAMADSRHNDKKRQGNHKERETRPLCRRGEPNGPCLGDAPSLALRVVGKFNPAVQGAQARKDYGQQRKPEQWIAQYISKNPPPCIAETFTPPQGRLHQQPLDGKENEPKGANGSGMGTCEKRNRERHRRQKRQTNRQSISRY